MATTTGSWFGRPFANTLDEKLLFESLQVRAGCQWKTIQASQFDHLPN